MNPEETAYHEVCAYTLSLGDPAFTHQQVVDAWAAQHARADGKSIALFFALVGLYLHVERGFTGREVQRAHMKLGERPEPWPVPPLPAARGTLTALDVIAAPAGAARAAMIHAWAESAWRAFEGSRETVEAVLRRRGIV